jgi:hypothetical protein
MMGAVHLLPGTTFSSVGEKGSYASEEHASLTLHELERWLALQIAGVYHLSIHSALGMTPLAAWRADAEKTKSPPRDPLDETEFFLSFLPAVPRQVRKDGIHLYNIRYWDNVLSPWAGRLKEPLWVKYDPRNLSRIYFSNGAQCRKLYSTIILRFRENVSIILRLPGAKPATQRFGRNAAGYHGMRELFTTISRRPNSPRPQVFFGGTSEVGLG